MPENPDKRYRVYREVDSGEFEYIADTRGVSAKDALATFLCTSAAKDAQEHERFLVRTYAVQARIELFTIVVPSRTFTIKEA
jgi:hypothetical protein